jgi:DNA-binding MarR family transcriptional regulator
MSIPDAATRGSTKGRAVWCRMSKLGRVTWDPMGREMRRAGLPTQEHYEALHFLSQIDRGSTPMTRLQEAISKPQYATSRIVTRLEREGLVSRTVSEVDRRTRLVKITARGRAIAARMQDAYQSLLQKRIGAKLRDSDLLWLEAVLGRIGTLDRAEIGEGSHYSRP